MSSIDGPDTPLAAGVQHGADRSRVPRPTGFNVTKSPRSSPSSQSPNRRTPVASVNDEERRVQGSGVQMISRVASMLRLLQSNPGGLSQVDIGERLAMARSTVSRILNALEDEGLVASLGPRGPYRLGPQIARMARTVRLGVVADMRPLLEKLSNELTETANLAILDGDRVTLVTQVVSPHPLSAICVVGESFPLHCCANGKALLANLPPAQQAQVLSGRLTRYTASTITTAKALRGELIQIRRDGVAYDRGEQIDGLCAVAVALQGVGDDRLAVSVSVPAPRFYGRETELAEALLSWNQNVKQQFHRRTHLQLA